MIISQILKGIYKIIDWIYISQGMDKWQNIAGNIKKFISNKM